MVIPGLARLACRLCDSHDLSLVLDLGSTPLADTFPASPDVSEVYYPLRVMRCAQCTLLQLSHVVPDALLYGAGYAFSTGASPAAHRAAEAFARDLMAWYGDHARRLTVEIGCNDGTLLSQLAAAGARVVGVDPAPEQAAHARDVRRLDVRNDAFSHATAKSLVSDHGRAGLVVAHNVLAHVDDVRDFAAGLATLLASDGVASVQVQYAADLVVGGQWDHVYHEHRSYFTLAALKRLFDGAGLTISGVDRTLDQGGSVRLTVQHRHAAARTPVVPTYMREHAALGKLSTYQAWQARVDYCRDRLLDLLDAELRAGRTVAALGATAKSCTLLTYAGIGTDRIPYVVDLTPHKQGRYTPGTHIPVVAPGQDDPDTYLLLAWNYARQIIRRHSGYTGRWIVPIPMPMVL